VHEWPVLPLRDSVEIRVPAAIFVLRARAAGKSNSQVGLSTVIRRALSERQV